ncbi:MAG: hypothetical protein ABEJ78_05605 [Haloferacaceae archaeon]
MPELQSCYFCGAVGDSLRECAAVPERLAPVEEEQRTVVLCTSCREKLRRVVEPLVTRLDDAAATPRDAHEPTRSDASDRPRADAAAGGSARQEVTFDAAAGDPSASAADEASESDGDDADESAATATGDASDSLTADADGTGATGDDSKGEADGDANDAATTADVPDGYYKVMRLLQNREFPIDRGELTALITGAYDVSDRECDAILETAKGRGVLAEEDGSLRLA